MLVSLALVSAGITLLYLGMRAVMDIGGMCASGGPYVVAQPCPDGVPLMMIGGIWVGLIAAFFYVWASSGTRVPSFVWLVWPALFMSLGWNFLEYAFNPPTGEGIVWGWLIPGVLFELMGGVPLAILITSRRALEPTDSVRAALAPPGTKAVATAMRAVIDARKSTKEPGLEPADMVSELERLDALHRSGALSDAEYARAKRRLLA